MDGWNVTNTAVAGLALVVAGAGLLYARKSAKAADAAAVAGQRSADAAERSAAAAEALVPQAPPLVNWRLEQGGKTLYRLRNLGTTTATNVDVVGRPRDAADLIRFKPVAAILAGDAVEIMILTVMGPTVTSLEVQCDELADPVVLPVI
ncbi:hypothetical protein R8Z50_21925 [Longispora sp. K20-0274]|uniref:hypothetical protein n=1 Tax=Longispora sp. K20-0274 TaxID=3088255 RepID=UPI00399AAE6B